MISAQHSLPRKSVLFGYVLFVVLGVLILPAYVHTFNNDGISYISIAMKYAGGHTAEAINPYWSPLYSWLIAGLILLGIPGLYAAKIVSLVAGFGSLVVFCDLCRYFRIDRPLSLILPSAVALLLLYFVTYVITPDLLLVFFLLMYLRWLFEPNIGTRPWHGVVIGIIANFAYLAKTVALPLIIIHSTVTLTYLFFSGPKSQRRRLIIHQSITLFVLLSLALPWALQISEKHGSFTFGENARVIHSTLGPQMANRVPFNVDGLFAPPDEYSTSVWDDPTKIAREDWSPFKSKANFFEQLRVMALNAEFMLTETLFPFHLSLYAILALFLVLCFSQRVSTAERRKAIILSSLWMIMFAIYLSFVTELRYFWIVLILSVAMGAELLTMFFVVTKVTLFQRWLATVLFMISFLGYPFWHMCIEYHHGDAFYEIVQQANARTTFAGKNLASDHWKRGHFFSYYVGGKYFGLPINASESVVFLDRELLDHKIDYYIVWKKKPIGLTHYREVFDASLKQVAVFKRI
jgi:hypothetical protein